MTQSQTMCGRTIRRAKEKTPGAFNFGSSKADILFSGYAHAPNRHWHFRGVILHLGNLPNMRYIGKNVMDQSIPCHDPKDSSAIAPCCTPPGILGMNRPPRVISV
jgi:hypothetical protein